MNRSDDDLIQQSLLGDSMAFRKLVERHQGYAFKLAWHILRREEDARDAVQDAFIQVWRHLSRFDVKSQFTTWLYRIVVNKALDQSRRYTRRAESPFSDISVPAASENPEELCMNRETVRMIREAADLLPEKQRLVFILRELQELSIKETADILKCSDQAVKSHLYAARKKLRGIIKKTEGVR